MEKKESETATEILIDLVVVPHKIFRFIFRRLAREPFSDKMAKTGGLLSVKDAGLLADMEFCGDMHGLRTYVHGVSSNNWEEDKETSPYIHVARL